MNRAPSRSGRKAPINRTHSRRFAWFGGARRSRSVWSACGFSAAFPKQAPIRWPGWFMESLDASFSAHCDHKAGRPIHRRGAENEIRTIAAFYSRRDSVFRHSDFLRPASFVLRHSESGRPGDGLHDGRQSNPIARQFAHLFAVAQHHDAMTVAHDFFQLR